MEWRRLKRVTNELEKFGLNFIKCGSRNLAPALYLPEAVGVIESPHMFSAHPVRKEYRHE